MGPRATLSHLIVGAFIYSVTVAAWLLASQRGIDTGPLFYMAGPVVAALFIASPLTKAADNAQQAAQQTNGVLGDRIKAAVAAALADRDAARTWQASVSDNNAAPPAPTTEGETK